ncbi:MAG: hypothetical protein QM706_20035 [Nitrospira sp.]
MRTRPARTLAAATVATGNGALRPARRRAPHRRPARARHVQPPRRDRPRRPVLPVQRGGQGQGRHDLVRGRPDYAFQQKPGLSRSNISLDYIERSSGGNTIRIFPVTVSQFSDSHGTGPIRPYYGIGAGVYFVRQNVPNDVGVQESRHKTALGGFLAAGLDLPSNLLVEARYHYITKVNDVNSSGLQVMVGIRFCRHGPFR